MTMKGSTAPPRRESLPDIVRQRAISANPAPAGSMALRQLEPLPRRPEGQTMALTQPPCPPRDVSTFGERLVLLDRGVRHITCRLRRGRRPAACADEGNSPLPGLAMITGLTEPASGAGVPSNTPTPGTTAPAPKVWPIDRVQAAAPALPSTATRPEKPPESAGVGPAGACPFHPANARLRPPAAAQHRRAGDAVALAGRRARLRHSGPQRFDRQAATHLRDLLGQRARELTLEELGAAALADRAQGAGKLGLGQRVAFGGHRRRRSDAPRCWPASRRPPANRATGREIPVRRSAPAVRPAPPSPPSAASRDGHASG